MEAILLVPPPMHRYFTGAVADEVSGDMIYHVVQSGVGIVQACVTGATVGTTASDAVPCACASHTVVHN